MKPVIILVKPQMSENIGMSARAMYNCGVETLRLVQPRDGWPSEIAMATSAECLKLMPSVEVFETLEEASHDLHCMYAATARPRYMEVDVFSPMDAGVKVEQQLSSGINVGLVFGGESSGLDNADIALCNGVITVPLNPAFKSLNLSQAVLLLCWEWWKNHNDEMMIPKRLKLDTPPATHAHVKSALDKLEDELEQRGFFRSASAEATIRQNLHAMFNRIGMNQQEVKMFHGIIRALTEFDKK